MDNPHQFVFKAPQGWNASLDLLSGRALTSDAPPFGLSWEHLMEDLLFISSERLKLGIDLGWYPDRSPSGEFAVELVDMTDADRLQASYASPLRRFTTRSLREAKLRVEAWMVELEGGRAEPTASPNGGPAKRSGNSRVSGGPPSVS